MLWPNKTFTFHDSSDFALHWFWDFGDGTTDTVQNPVHVYDTTGTYIIKLIVYYGNCSDSVVMNVYVINNTGIDINSSDIKLKCKIFPNPTNDLLYISMKGIVQTPFTITICDMQGKTVKQITTKQSENVIDISGLEQGVYGVRVVGDFNVVERFVKMWKMYDVKGQMSNVEYYGKYTFDFWHETSDLWHLISMIYYDKF